MTVTPLATDLSPAAPEQVRRARRGLVLYFSALVPFSLVGYEVALSRHSHLLLMFAPALASIVARLALREGFGDVSFRLRERRIWRGILVALLFPLLVAIIAYGLAWGLGLAQFQPPPTPADWPHFASPAVTFAFTLVATLVFALVPTLPLGEELGWRGYMLTRLVDTGVPRPLLVSSLIWGAWHLPIIVAGTYRPGNPSAPLLVQCGLFLVVVVAFGSFLGGLRLATGSIWPPVVAHGAWNLVIQAVFDPATHGATARLWTGEAGLLVIGVTVVGTLLLWQTPLLRRP
ncbi:MAG: CPBP family intramembrane metalloprotease [Chloroflexales bacterium]|nr:CPBP family intramembrane metalloprotease [Chloroflexales bacterium]